VATGFDSSTPQPQLRRDAAAAQFQAPARTETQSRAPEMRGPESTEKPRTASRRTSAPRAQVEMQIPELIGSDELDIPPFLRRR
jgi:hypothetical protein